MRKSILITFYFPPSVGGIQDYLENVCTVISDKIVVLAPKGKGDYRFDKKQNYKIYRYNFFYYIIEKYSKLYKFFIFPILFLFIFHGWGIIRREKIDIIQSGSADFSLSAWILSKLNKKPYIVYCHGKDILVKQKSFLSKIWKNKIISFGLKCATIIITNSQFTKTKIIQLGVKENKISIINPCIKENMFYPNTNQVELISIIEKYNLKNKKVLLTVGRLVTRKGHGSVMKSLPTILKQFPDTVYLIVGNGSNEKKLKNLVKELDLEKSVIFVGYVPDNQVNLYYNICDIFVMPSCELPGDVEGFGIVYLEANACGKPVIGSKSGGIEDAVIDGKTGLLVNPDNIKEISDSIIKIFSDTNLTENLKRQGKERVISEFSINNMYKKINNVLNILDYEKHSY